MSVQSVCNSSADNVRILQRLTADGDRFTATEFRVLTRTEGYVSEQDVLGTLAKAIQKILARLFHVLFLGLLCQPIYAFQNGQVLLYPLTHVAVTSSVARVAFYF